MRGQGVADALGHARQVRRHVGIPRAQHDQGQRQAERGRPAPAPTRSPSPTSHRAVHTGNRTGRRGSAAITITMARRWSLPRVASHGAASELTSCTMTEPDSARPGLGRCSGHDRSGSTAASQTRCRPGTIAGPCTRSLARPSGSRSSPANAISDVVRTLFLADLRQPEHGGNQCRDDPETQAQRPAVVEMLARTAPWRLPPGPRPGTGPWCTRRSWCRPVWRSHA